MKLNLSSNRCVSNLIEQALQGEMDAHLGYDRYERHSGTNSRNGSSKKTLKTEKGPIAISVPRDRDGSFEPQIVPKGQTRTGVLDDQIIALYSKGMSTREISETIKELYDVDVSATLISSVTGRVINEVIQWQNRPLDAVYPIVFMDCIVSKSVTINVWSTKPSLSRWGSIYPATKNYWVFGWQKMREASSGYRFQPNLRIGVLKIF